MIQHTTHINIADNSGAVTVKIIKMLQGNSKAFPAYGAIGVSSIKLIDNPLITKVKKGQVHKIMLMRQKRPIKRLDGSLLAFDSSAALLLNSDLAPIASRFSGPLPREIKDLDPQILAISTKFF